MSNLPEAGEHTRRGFVPEVAIPSYQRADILLTHTLSFLLTNEYPAEKITIFVADQVECEVYRAKLPSGSYGRLVVGQVGLANQRNCIANYYAEGQILLQLDDDIKDVKMLREGIRFTDWVRFGVASLKKHDAGLFGPLPNDDGRKMSEDLTTHLTHIIGCCFLCVNHKGFKINLSEKEDYLRSIWYFNKYGKVLRWKASGVKTKYTGNPGGLQQPGRADRMKEGRDYLLETYPGLCKARVKNGTPDLLLNWRAKPSLPSP